MVTGQFFPVIGMSPIGFKNRFLFLGLTLAQKILVAAYNPFNDGFWAKISIFFFFFLAKRNERWS